VTTDTRKAVALLAYLAVTGRRHGRDILAGLLWPDADQEHSRSALRRTLSALGKGLGPGWLRADRESVELVGDGLGLDVSRFRELAREAARAGEPASRISRLQQAAELYRDDFMAGFTLRDADRFDEWQAMEGEALRHELAIVLERLVTERAAAGAVDAAIESARRWLSLDTLHEPAHRWLMELYAAAGDRSAALRQYRDCVRVLERELGVPPLEDTTATYQAILAGDTVAERPLDRPAPIITSVPEDDLLVGREAELDQLRASYRSTGPDGRMVVIVGEPGIGKTRLAEELLGDVRTKGGRTITVACYEGETELAYAPLATALRAAIAVAQDMPSYVRSEAARLLPGLGAEPPPAPLHDPAAEARFYDAAADIVTRACSGSVPGVLFLDDLHWADEASLDAFGYLLHRLEGRGLCVVCAWRSGTRTERLDILLRTGRAPAVVEPGRLGADDVQALSDRQAAGVGVSTERILTDTRGVPLLVTEYLRALRAGGAPRDDLPSNVRRLLLARVSETSEMAGQVLAAAAIVGRPCDADLLRAISGRSDEETVLALEELAARGLMRPSSSAPESGAYEIQHARIREVACDNLSPARRRLLHRRTADALTATHRATEPQAARIAAHLERAGLEDQAAVMHARAGMHAYRLAAHTEALEHLEAALALGHPDLAWVYETIGDVHTLQGAYDRALRSYETAASHAEGDRLAIVEQKLAQLHQRRGDWALSETHLRAAEAVLKVGGDNQALQARIAADRCLTAHELGRPHQARAAAQGSLEFAEAAHDPAARAQAHNVLGILLGGTDPDAARRHLQASLALTGRLEDPSARVAALNNLARLEARSGDHDSAVKLLEEALEACRRQGDRHREAALCNNLADVLHAADRGDEAMARLKEAVTIFADIDDPAQREPEIWKLTTW
jgi:DNA-binding SARP family transcriptional activator